MAYGADRSECLKAIEEIEGVPGRLQHVQSLGRYHKVYVDYAHTPDALGHVLGALRPHVVGKLICVFGAGGDRDKDKRSKMGEIVSSLADIAIITDDNPRSEVPQDIRNKIKSGMKDGQCSVHDVADRRSAIEHAISMMTEDDVVLIAGKGHEQGQIFANVTHPFDDVTETENILRKLN